MWKQKQTTFFEPLTFGTWERPLLFSFEWKLSLSEATGVEKTGAVARSSQPTSFESPRLVETKLCLTVSETSTPGKSCWKVTEKVCRRVQTKRKRNTCFLWQKTGLPWVSSDEKLESQFSKNRKLGKWSPLCHFNSIFWTVDVWDLRKTAFFSGNSR